MSAFTNIINKMFSQKVFIKRMPGGRLKTIDYNKLQSIGSSISGKFTGVRTSLSGTHGHTGYNAYSDNSIIDAARNRMYIDYEAMETDPILCSALDIYADETTIRNEQGRLLTINSDSDQVKKILHNLYYDILNIEFNLWHWVRSLCKYGDLFIYTPTQSSIGIIDAVPIHPSLIKRLDFTGEKQDETQFVYVNTNPNYNSYNVVANAGSEGEHVFRYHEIAHFRILTDTNYLPYGKSLLEGARKIYKQLTMMEDAMLIHRIMRAPQRRIFKIDVGNLPPESIDAYIEEIANSMKKIPYKDPETGDYNLRFNLMNMLEDFYLPTRGGDSSTSIETLDGLSNDGSLEDIEYLLKKQMAYLKIPRAYLGYDEGVEGKGTLAAEDIKFARFIERIQQIVVSELQKMGHIHLAFQGFSPEEATNFSLQLSTPSLIYERQKVDLLNEKIDLAVKLTENKMFSKKWQYEQLFNMSPDEWTAEQDLILEDLKRAFREEQIKSEGNDPAVTGQSLGTPHDIVAMQMASKLDSVNHVPKVKKLFKPDGRQDNPGRPVRTNSYETDDDLMGRDPTGRLAMQTPLYRNAKLERMLTALMPKSSILTEAVTDDIVSGSLLELIKK